MLNVKLVTGKHMITDDVQKEIDNFFEEDNIVRHMYNSYLDFDMFTPCSNTWDDETYLLYNNVFPVAIFNPSFNRWNRHVTAIKPVVFEKGKGYGSFIFAWCINHYFKQGFNKISTRVYGHNEASFKLNENFLNIEGRRLNELFINNEYKTVYDFGLLKSQYDSDKKLQDKVKNILEVMGNPERI